MRSLLAASVLVLVLPACGGRLEVAPDADGGTSCSPEACGPNTMGASVPCDDGTTPGDICARGADGTCRWGSTGCPPAKKCGAYPGGTCSTGQYCRYDSCPLPGASGTCTATPGSCPEVYSPVCGCNGTTYTNRCFAALEGAAVARDGECGTTTGCMNDASCGKGSFCSFPDGMCPTAPAPGPTPPSPAGTCKLRPAGCPDLYAPVCGCDGKTYGNHCDADSVGANVLYAGTCDRPPPPAKSCGGFVGAPCAKDEWCDYPTTTCGGADETGVCRPRPGGCDLLYAPVCGCDRKTYPNECAANKAGIDITATGPCK